MDPPGYSDPIIIPITLTISDPRPRPGGGRWDLDGPAPHHPSFTDPGWFKRQNRELPVLLAQFIGTLPAPLPPVGIEPASPPTVADMEAAVERARRRAQHALGEIKQGNYGDAAGHLLLGQPYPMEVESSPGPVFHTVTVSPDEEPSPEQPDHPTAPGVDGGDSANGNDAASKQGADSQRKPRPPNTKGLERQIYLHKKKLEEYLSDPDGNDNKGLLLGKSEEQRRDIIRSRVENLRNQIKTFERDIRTRKGR